MGIMNLLFALLSMAVFGMFAYNLKKTWVHITTIGKGAEEIRNDSLFERFLFMLEGGLLQKRMFKDPVPGTMHIVIFWGFVTVSLGTLETLIHGIYTPFSFELIFGNGVLYQLFMTSQDLGNFGVFAAISFAIARRAFFPPDRLKSLAKASKVDAYIVLSFIWVLVGTALVTMGAKNFNPETASKVILPFSNTFAQVFAGIFSVSTESGWHTLEGVFWWVHVFALFGFTTFLPYSKHQHLIWVWPNMLFKSRKGSGRLRPMEFNEEAESFGVGKVEEFTWKQLLDGMACVECGRCTDVCPAQETGKKLDPRLMIHHLKDAMQLKISEGISKDSDKKSEQEAQEAEQTAKPLIGGIVSKEELWACTTCGACMEACPLHIEHIPAIVDMRRYLTMTEGDMPEELQGTLENLEVNSNPWGMNNDSRGDWAKDLNVTTMAEKSDVDYLFWVGCAGSFDERYKKVSKSLVTIMQNAGVTFSILGSEEQCNGDTARRAGNEYLADMQIQQNVETFKKYNVKKVVTSCPHCFNTIKNEYPDFGYKTEVIHHSEMISDLLKEKKLNISNKDQENLNVTYHDSCYLGRHNKIYESPRESLSQIPGVKLKEMERNKENGFCCGAGGARMWMEETEGERINVNRTKEAIQTGADTIATACPFCMTMMNDGLKTCEKENDIKVMDISEVVAQAVTERS